LNAMIPQSSVASAELPRFKSDGRALCPLSVSPHPSMLLFDPSEVTKASGLTRLTGIIAGCY
jgi:hypothetical protein